MDDRMDIPETLDELSDEDLVALAESIADAGTSLGPDAASSDEATAEIERLADEFDRINSELESRQALAEERAARTDAALSRFAPVKVPAPDETDGDGTPQGGDDDADITPTDTAPPKAKNPFPPKKTAAAAEAEEFMAPQVPADDKSHAPTAPGQAGTDPANSGVHVPQADASKMTLMATDEVTELAAGAEAVTVTTVVVETDDDDDDDSDAGVPDGIPGLSTESTEVLAADAAPTTADEADPKEMSVDESTAVVPTTEALSAALESTAGAPTQVKFAMASATRREAEPRPFSALQTEDGRDISTGELAERIVEARHRMGNVKEGTYELVSLARGTHEYPSDLQVSVNEMSNFAVFENIKSRAEGLVASGGTCAPLTPSYDIFRLAEPQSPVENALPSVGATRGGIRHIVPPVYTQASGGVAVTTNAQDIAGYTNQTPAGTTSPKPCVSVVCPGVNDVFVDAVSQCVQFGNLNYRVFPEQVESFMKDLAVVFAQVKETKYLDAINANSTAVNLTPDYGAARALTFALNELVWAYRKRNHMATDAVLDVYLPDSVLPLLKADMVNDLHLGLNFLNASIDDVKAEVFGKLNINAVFYYDYATGDLPNMQQAQGAGTVVPFLASVSAFIFAPGTFVRLDGGTLDVGIVRDSALNGTNNLQIFAEEWVQVAKVGLESVRANITLCPSGTGPSSKTGLVCAS